MTTIAEARESCYQRWNNSWTATPLADTTFAGEGFTPPEKREWARLSVRHSTASGGQTLGGVGSRRFTRLGTVFVECYAPLGDEKDGEGQIDPLVQNALNIFEGVSFDGLRFFQAVPRETGEDAGKWTRALVEVPFDYDETK